VIVSDILIMKSFSYVGYIMLFCVGFSIFIWHNNKSFQEMLYTMMQGLKWTLPVILIYCVGFRGKKEGIYYNGCFPQHESMAMYALALLIVFLAECHLLIGQNRWYQRRFVFSGIGVVLSLFLLYYSRTMLCVAAAIVVLLIWIFQEMWNRRKWYQKGKKILGSSAIIIICGLFLTIGLREGVKLIPERQGTNLIYENEVQVSMLSEELMYALEAEQPGWMYGVVPEDTQDIKYTWKTYMQRLNLIGNADNLREEERYQNPYNGILQMVYRYGVFVLIPYGILLVQAIWSALKERKFLWLAIMLAFLVVFIGENLEIPFAQPLWLMFYLEIGRMFGSETKDDERLEITDEGIC